MSIPQSVQKFLDSAPLDAGELDGLRDWTKRSISEIENLVRQIRRQELEFRTILEASNMIHARAVDNANPSYSLNHQIKFLINTAKGYLGVADVRILTNNSHEGVMEDLGGHARPLSFKVNRPFIDALTSAPALELSRPNREFKKSEAEIGALCDFKYEVVVPLLAETGLRDIRLEGAICFGRKMSGEAFSHGSIRFMSLLGSLLGTAIHNAELHQRSIIDSLTQVFTRGYFDMYLEKEIARYRRQASAQSSNPDAKPKSGISLLMLDIDKFKDFNDTYGHQVGDEVLRIVGDVLRLSVRHNDVVARYGGEEFAVIASGASIKSASELAERIREKIEAAPVRVNGQDVIITASFGVSEFPSRSTSLAELIQHADEALYRAKKAGRNRVEVY